MSKTTRTIEHRTRGAQHGFIRRMVSPNGLGEVLKPFIFLDHVHGHVAPGTGFGWHPHSGLATLTYSLNSDVAYEDTAGQKGRVLATGLEWMRAGGGTWHRGSIHPREETVTSFQLWVALPPGVEDGPPEGIYVPPERVPQVGNVRVLLGAHGGQENPIPAPSPLSYLDVTLGPGEVWAHSPPAGHVIAWAFVYWGRARIGGELIADELVVLAEGPGEVRIEAEGPARVLVGTAARHEHPLVLGDYSVHTNPESLARGEENIRAVRGELRRSGRL
jgi:redox-sensitive bicupin YhaK (pirin superfamily)